MRRSYFEQRFNNELRRQHSYCKATALCCPGQLKRRDAALLHGGGPGLGIEAVRADLQAEFFGARRRWGDALTVDKLIAELPQLLVLVRADNFSRGISSADLATRSEEARAFWVEHRGALPTWFHLSQVAFTVVPTSASVERLFSVLKRVFGCLSERSDEDLIELSCLLKYNSRG